MTFPPQMVIAATPGTSAERRDPPDLKRAETVEKGHGRIETRRIAVRTKLPSRLDQNWPGIKAICRIERIRELKDRCSREVIYAITSVPLDKLNAAALLQLSRDHWAIENSLFHVRDVTFREDACRARRIAQLGPHPDPTNRPETPPRPRSLRGAEVARDPVGPEVMN